MPSARLSTVGWAPPSADCAHGHTAFGSAPNHSVTAIGTTPSASRSSCSVNPALTTRLGGAGIVVSPKACLMVTAPPPGSPLADLFDEHAATTANPVAPATPRNPRLLRSVCTMLRVTAEPRCPRGKRLIGSALQTGRSGQGDAGIHDSAPQRRKPGEQEHRAVATRKLGRLVVVAQRLIGPQRVCVMVGVAL